MQTFKSQTDGQLKPNLFASHRYLDSGNGYSVCFDAAGYTINERHGMVEVYEVGGANKLHYHYTVVFRAVPTLWCADKFLKDLRAQIERHMQSVLFQTNFQLRSLTVNTENLTDYINHFNRVKS